MKVIELDLPLPPTINHYYLSSGKRRYLSAEAKAFRLDVLRARATAGHTRLTGRLQLTAVLHMKTRGRADLDNRVKPLQDALQWAGIYDDDEQIDALIIVRGKVKKGGRCAVHLKELGDVV